MFLFLLSICLFSAARADMTLPGDCPDVTLQENLDSTEFAGVWYNVGNYGSDGRQIYDCSTLDFQEDNIGYTLKETYIDVGQGKRTLKSYVARVDPTFDAGKKAKFIVSYENEDKILQFPFFILSTDYKNYAIAYTCSSLKKRKPNNSHYVYTWILSRSNGTLEGDRLQTVETALAQYTELAEHRQSFVFKGFSEEGCSYTDKMETNFFTGNFW